MSSEGARPQARSARPIARRGAAVTARIAWPLAIVVPVVVSVAWIPVRTSLPNTDLALILVVVVGLAGFLGRRSTVLVAALSAALSFEFFDTSPFERLAISRQPDLETTIFIAVVAAAVGELTFRMERHRRARIEEADRLRAVESASTMLATGEELVAVVEQCADQIGRLLGLERCFFEVSPGGVTDLRLERDGRLVVPSRGSEARREGSGALTAELPVLGLGEELGHFVLVFGPALPRRDQLLVAVTLADQAGAAIAAQVPAGGGDPGPPMPTGPLRLLR